MRRTHGTRRLRSDDNGVTATIGTIGMTAISVIVLVGGSLVAAEIQPQLEGLSLEGDDFSVLTRTDGERHEVTLTSGQLDLAALKFHLSLDGTAHVIGGDWFLQTDADGQWSVGEWYCLSGDAPECATPYADVVSLTIVSGNGAPTAMGQLSAANYVAQDADPIEVVSKRVAFFIGADGVVVLQEAAQVHLRVIGTEITMGSTGPDIPVTVRPSIDGGAQYSDPFQGPVHPGLVANLGVLPAGAELGAEANAALSWFSKTRSNFDDPVWVPTLRHGDPLPSTPAFSGQIPVGSLLGPYAQDGFIVLDQNEVMLLFELGTDNINSAAADFQDLVVIFTVDPEPLPASLEGDSVFQLMCEAGWTIPVSLDDVDGMLGLGATIGECSDDVQLSAPVQEVADAAALAQSELAKAISEAEKAAQDLLDAKAAKPQQAMGHALDAAKAAGKSAEAAAATGTYAAQAQLARSGPADDIVIQQALQDADDADAAAAEAAQSAAEAMLVAIAATANQQNSAQSTTESATSSTEETVEDLGGGGKQLGKLK